MQCGQPIVNMRIAGSCAPAGLMLGEEIRAARLACRPKTLECMQPVTCRCETVCVTFCSRLRLVARRCASRPLRPSRIVHAVSIAHMRTHCSHRAVGVVAPRCHCCTVPGGACTICSRCADRLNIADITAAPRVCQGRIPSGARRRRISQLVPLGSSL